MEWASKQGAHGVDSAERRPDGPYVPESPREAQDHHRNVQAERQRRRQKLGKLVGCQRNGSEQDEEVDKGTAVPHHQTFALSLLFGNSRENKFGEGAAGVFSKQKKTDRFKRR